MQVGDVFVELGLKDDQFRRGLQDAQNETKGFGDKVSSAMSAAKVGSGLLAGALAGVGIAGLAASVEINRGMANVASLMPGNSERVNELKGDIQALAIETGKSTSDMADGLYNVVSAFGDSADTAAILGTNAKAAAAGLATTSDAINLTSAVTKGYGDTSAAAVDQVADMALMTVRLGQTTFPELAGSIGKVTPLASAMGVSMEELFGTMATATGVTGGAAEVSTQLRGVLQSLAAPTAEMTALIKEKGYASGEAMLADLGLADTLDLVVGAAKDSGQPLQKYIGSVEGMTLAMALTGPQADVWREKMAAMGDAAGTTEEAFWEQTEGINALGFAFDQMKAVGQVALQKIGDVLGNTLKPVLKDIVGAVKNLVQNWDEVVGSIDPQVWAIVAGALAGALVPALWAAATAVWGIIAPLIPFIAIGAAVGFAVDTLVKKFGGWDVIREKVSNAIEQIRMAWDFLVDGFTGGGDPAALEGFWRKVYDFGVNVRQTFEDVKTAISNIWQGILTTMGPVIETLKSSFASLKDSLGPALDSLKNAWDALKPALATVAAILGGVLAVALGVIIGVINGVIRAIGPLIQAFSGLVAIVVNIFNLIVGIFTGDGDKIKAAVSGIVTGVTDYFNGMKDAVWGLISGFVEGIIGFFTGLWDALVGHSIVPDMINAIVEWFTNLVGWVMAPLQALWDTVVGVFTGIFDGSMTIWEGLKTGLVAVWNFLKAIVTTVFNGYRNIILGVWNAIRTATTAVWNGIRTGVVAVWNAIKSAATTAWNAVKNAVMAVWNALVGEVARRVDNIKTNLTNAWNAIKSGASSAWNGIKTTILNLWDGLVNAVKSKISAFTQIGKDIANGIKNGISNVWSGLVNKLKNLTNLLPAAVKKILGIASPSKVFAGLAKAIPEGLGKGVTDNAKVAVGAVRTLAGRVTDAFEANKPEVDWSVAGQMKAMGTKAQMTLAGAGPVSNTITIAPGAIVVHGASDPDAVADTIMRKLHRMGVKF